MCDLARTCAVFFILLGTACGASSASQDSSSSAPPPAVAPEAPSIESSPPPMPGATDYRTGLIAALRTAFPGSAVDSGAGDVVILRQRGRKKRDIVVTTGLGRAPREDGDPRVELLAYVPAYGPGVGEVLLALAAHLEKLKAYEAVELAAPVRTLRYFDLLPGAEVNVLGASIRLYRVVPLTAAEFEEAAESEGSQWVGGEIPDPDASARALERWAPALDGSGGS